MSKLITLSNLERFKTNADNAYAAKPDVATLIGSDTGKSVRTIANEELAAALILADAQESLDTLGEIAAWIQEHPGDAAAMNTAITALQNKVNTGNQTVTAYVTAAINALNIGDYATAANLTALASRVSTAEGKVAALETTVNGLGDLATKDTVSEADLANALKEKVNAAAEGNHAHGNKTVLDNITANKVAGWDAKSDFSGDYNDLTNKPTIPAAYSHPNSHPASMITGLAAVATSGNYADLNGTPTVATDAEIDALFA